jgi:hypothetical protein
MAQEHATAIHTNAAFEWHLLEKILEQPYSCEPTWNAVARR